MDNLTLIQLRDKIAGGDISAMDALDHAINRINKVDPTIKAYISTHQEEATGQAIYIDEQISGGQPVGILAGVPIALKDNMVTLFGRTTCGSKMLENFSAPYDAHVVEKLKAAGAVIVGKCNMDEFAMGSSNENSAFFATHNPWDKTKVPGGSSGGSAAAVAAKTVWGALGSDTGGSIRQPASFCGVVGLKPTYGRVSRYGLVAYGSSLDQIGPLTKTVSDAALMLQVIAGHDDRDSTSIDEKDAPVDDYLCDINKPIAGLKIGVVKEFMASEGLDPQVAGANLAALEQYKKMGAEIIEISLPHIQYAIATYYLVATAEASGNLARYDGIHYGHRTTNTDNVLDVYSASRSEGFGDEVKRRIMLGTYALSSGYYDAFYLKALKVRNLIRQDLDNALKLVDCIISPTAPETAFAMGAKTNDPLTMYLSDIYTIAVNLGGHPAISIPCGISEENLPIGMQIITPAFTETKLLRIARMYESTDNFASKLPQH
jgi:aspartyl-tRNA(Asn)/glutamyl-tRNA(Gln) amidotransferase subunit A